MSTDRSDPSLEYTLPFQLTKTIHRQVQDELQPENDENRAAAKDKIVVVTGGGTGIGAAIARVWARAGAAGVVLAGRRKDKLDETVEALEALNTRSTKFLVVATDVTKNGDTDDLFAQVKGTFGRTADVVFANSGAGPMQLPGAEGSVDIWWNTFAVNLLGVHNTVASWINSQSDPKKPVGTVIDVNSGHAGLLVPGNSAYAVSKFASHRYMEFVHTEYPTLRSFTILPGIVDSAMNRATGFDFYARDEGEQTGAWGLYLASERGDYLVGSLTSVNWDVAEMEAHREEIRTGLLRNKWVPVLPAGGGKGFQDY